MYWVSDECDNPERLYRLDDIFLKSVLIHEKGFDIALEPKSSHLQGNTDD